MEQQQLEQVAADVEQVRKRQRKHNAHAMECVDALTAELTKSVAALENADADSSVADVVATLFETVSQKEIPPALAAEQKSLHSAISKLGKSIDKVAAQDLVTQPHELPASLSQMQQLQVVVEHLYRDGEFSAGDMLSQDAALGFTHESKLPLKKLHDILAALQGGDLTPAITWATVHRTVLQRRRSSLEFALHRQQFTHLLRGGDSRAALQYARAHFSSLSTEHQQEAQQLMGALIYVKNIAESPYASLLDPSHGADLRELFLREACAVMGLCAESPLHLTVLAGCMAFPALLRFASLMQSKGVEWSRVGAEMQAEVELGPQFHFHSVFVCPVSREQSTPENPPVLLPCGHVICRLSMMKLVRANSRFKCPYCPTDVHLEQVKYVNFF